MSQIVEEKVALYKQRPVKRRYTALFYDATFINVRRDTVAKDRLEAEAKLADFVEKREGQSPEVTAGYQMKDNLFTFLDFPETIRSSLYTNNISENFNKQLKRKTKAKEQFPSEDALEKASSCYVSEYNAKFGQRIHKGFKHAQFQIAELFEKVCESKTRDIGLKNKKSTPMGNEETLEFVS